MAGKNRVGSLYMELVLDPSKFARGTRQAVKDHKRMQKELSKAHNGLDPRAKAAADLKLAKQAAMRQVKLKKATFAEGKAIVRAATANYKAEIRKIDIAIHESHKKQVRSLQEKNDKELADIKMTMKEKKRLEDRAIADQVARTKKMQAHARRRRQQRLAAERAQAAQVAAIRNASFAGGVFGAGSMMAGVGAVTGAIGKVTQAMFPLMLAGYAVIAMFRRLKRVLSAWVGAADRKTKDLLVLTTLMHGNAKAANELRVSLVAYAKATAFSIEQTMQLAVQMKALGFVAHEIPAIMAKLGRLAFGDSAKLKLIAKAYSDVKAQGKLLMTEVRQFANQGVPLLAQLQMDMGKSALQVRDDMKAGLITFEMVEKAINNIASAYGNVDEAGLATVSGQMEAAGEAWKEILAKTGESETLLAMAKGLNQILRGMDKLVGNTKLLDKILQSIAFSTRLTLAIMTFGTTEYIRLGVWLKQLHSGELEYNKKEKEYMDGRKKKQEEINRLKREELEAESRRTAAANVILKAQETSLDFLKRKAKLQAEIDSSSTDPAVKAKADKDLAKLEREAALQEEIEASQKRISQEASDTITASGQYNLSDKDKKLILARAEMRKAAEEAMIKAKHAAKNAQEDRDKAKEDAENLAKIEEEAAEKLRKQKEEWKQQDIEDAKKLIKIAKDAQADFEKKQDEANKFKDMAPQTSPSFQANSVAEFTFRKEKELQRDKQREENKREAARKEHAEQLNVDLILAIKGIGLNETDPDLGFEAIE